MTDYNLTRKPNIREALAPCPFCGDTDPFVERADYTACYVQCNECIARGPTCVQESDDETTPGQDGAIAAWNRRAALSAAPPEREIWQHIRSRGKYEILHRALIEADGTESIVYRSIGDDDTVWVRPRAEFYDGRFVKINATETPIAHSAVASTDAAARTETPELLPCPFCGFDPCISHPPADSGIYLARVSCPDCETSGPEKMTEEAVSREGWPSKERYPADGQVGLWVHRAHNLADRVDAAQAEIARVEDGWRVAFKCAVDHQDARYAAEKRVAELEATVRAADAMRDAAVAVIQEHILPASRLSDAEAIARIYGIFDGPLQRTFDAARAQAPTYSSEDGRETRGSKP